MFDDDNKEDDNNEERELIKGVSDLVPKSFTPKIWGYEQVIDDTPYYQMKTSFITSSGSSSAHYHKDRVETIYITKGGMSLSIGKPKDESLWLSMNKYENNHPNLSDAELRKLIPLEDQWDWKTILLTEGMRYRINPFELHWLMGNFILSPSGCYYTEVSNIHYEKDIYRIVSSTCDLDLTKE